MLFFSLQYLFISREEKHVTNFKCDLKELIVFLKSADTWPLLVPVCWV